MGRPLIGVDVRALVGTVSGIGYYTRSLLDRLARSGWADYVGMAHGRIEGEDALRRAGVRFDYRAAPLGVIWQQILLPRQLHRQKVDLYWSPLFTLPLTANLPSVVTIHDLTPLLYPASHTLKVRMSILPFLRRTIDKADRIIADSEATAADMRRRFPPAADKVRVVYPGVDPEFVPGDETAIAQTREQLGFRAGYILFAGTLEPRKNVGFLLDAWEALRQLDPNAPGLVLAGGYGWRSGRLLKRIRRLERTSGLVYLGRIDRDRLVRTFQAASIFVLPSLYEGFGLPAVEAMACAVPTVVTNTSSLPEIVGDAGLTVEPDDQEGLTDVLRRLSESSAWAAEIGAAGRQRAGRFDWQRATGEIEQVFREALR